LQIYFVNGGSPSTSTYRRLKRKSLNRHFSPTSKVRNSADTYPVIAEHVRGAHVHVRAQTPGCASHIRLMSNKHITAQLPRLTVQGLF